MDKKYIDFEAAKWQIYREFITDKETAIRAFRAIKTVSAADVRPVVKAYWIDLWSDLDQDTSAEAKCSSCGNTSARPVGNFCKWCGADMREEN